MAPVPHPAKFSDPILDKLKTDIFAGFHGRILDPFGGVGRIHQLANEHIDVVACELEPEWAEQSPGSMVVCDSCAALPLADNSIDAICTSPTYGNRMADHHEAKDASERNTYTHKLGRQLHPANTGAMQWGPEYRTAHLNAWKECARVLDPCGLFVVNVSDHYRKGSRIEVTGWHAYVLVEIVQLKLVDILPVVTRRQRNGANADLRTDAELILVFTP